MKLFWIGALFLFSSMARADSVDAVHLGESTSREEVIDLLTPQKPKTRGVALHSPNAASAPAAPRALSLEIYFDFDSAELKRAAKNQLTPVGEALQSRELASVSFTLEGHTDALGKEAYNMMLSKARADSVKAFLVEQFDIAPHRISSVGKGETELQNPKDPDAAVNRRVKIIAY